MTTYLQLVTVCLSFLTWLTVGSNAVAADRKVAGAKQVVPGVDSGEARMIADLASGDPRKVMNALGDLEEKPNPGTNAITAARKLVFDPRPAVRKKAARTLGLIHAPVGPDELKAIYRMLKSYDKGEADEALKALRDLNPPEAIPEIVPLLKSPHDVLVRDACRTLAVLGTKEQIPLIEPLLKHRNADVRTDAQAAITVLQAKK